MATASENQFGGTSSHVNDYASLSPENLLSQRDFAGALPLRRSCGGGAGFSTASASPTPRTLSGSLSLSESTSGAAPARPASGIGDGNGSDTDGDSDPDGNRRQFRTPGQGLSGPQSPNSLSLQLGPGD